ncbi:MAG TPA: glycoside hydrolase, partial [Mycobacterium sp.]|nr:glycoside hydrolase [Mycobacterium sp.]
MPSVLVAALLAPIREVQSLVGTGSSREPAGALMGVRDALADVSTTVRRTWKRVEANWFGAGADAAAEFAALTAATADELSGHVERLGRVADTAAAAVARARERLQNIVEDFEARAAALEPYLDSPGVVEGLMAEARRSLAEAIAVVDELRTELDEHAATLTAPPAPAATTPAGLASPPMAPTGAGFGAGAPMSPVSGMGGASTSGGFDDLAAFSPRDVPHPDAAAFGDGFAIRLPDGSTAMAPNAVAASAVRHALSQLGVPYQWGGTTPGVGLDCSGLTQ